MASRTLAEDLLLLSSDAPRKRLRIALKAVGSSVRAAKRAAAATHAEIAALRDHVGRVLFKPAQATTRDQELIACLLCAGALSGRQRMYARSLLRSVQSPPPAIAWLCRYYGDDTVPALVERLLRDTAPQPTADELDHVVSRADWLP